ncbi:S-layer homology domain-containing protein [Candidatus Peribacteria bacterium]|nr:S-layer homology domain-containing protein [Candidatus Peribacteria bacterium]
MEATVLPFCPFSTPCMRHINAVLAVTLVFFLSAPMAIAKFYPEDFMIPETFTPVTDPASDEPFFFASDIPTGKLTRAEFIDAIATRLYDADQHDSCFGGLILSESVDYNLLYIDVSLDASYASSVCVSLRNGVAEGFNDYTFRPTQNITVAEAAQMLSNVGGLPLRDSNHVMPWEPWHLRYMDAIRAVDREFTMQPGDVLTGKQLEHTLCVLKRYTSELDPMDEFTGC